MNKKQLLSQNDFSLFNLDKIDNESDVEAIIIERLLPFLGYLEEDIKRKDSIQKLVISKGSKKENYKPDYVIFLKNKPCIVIDAKAPNIILEDYTYQVSGYALLLNQKIQDSNPCQITVLVNDKYLKVYRWDMDNPFYDTEIKNLDFAHLKAIIGKESIIKSSFTTVKENKNISKDFTFLKPSKDEISKAFYDINNYIWKKEGMKPTDAFWEFVKLFSLKMENDKQLHKKHLQNEKIEADDVFFSISYIERQSKDFPKKNPMKVRFDDFRNELESKIIKDNKKRLFHKAEELNLSLETVKFAVEKLQNYNLSDIDEDLNGRMFEVFLRASVRGKELGQYFTPRDVIKFMVKVAKPNEHTKVLDSCCGSGGFLIEALAYMLNNIPTNISDEKREEISNNIKQNLIIGVDKEEKVTRLARINMYVHKDGSSSIFRVKDALDKELRVDDTLISEEVSQYAEAKKILKDSSFQIVLTNPPFASNYKIKDIEDKQILKDYTVVQSKGSVNSNILFIERYYDLLEGGGKLLTVIDDSLLNADSQNVFRGWIAKRFHIKMVVSLPFNTFKNASTTIKTSILYLEKKKVLNEISQDKIFMAICNNIGHDDSGKNTSDRNNLNTVYERWTDYINKGFLNEEIIENQVESELLTCPLQIFTIDYKDLDIKRFDAFFYSPELKKIQNKINSLPKESYIVKKGGDFILKKPKGKTWVNENNLTSYNYIEVGDCNKKGDIINFTKNNLEELPTRARIIVNENDVITPKNISSLYSTCFINKRYNNFLVSTGFLVFTGLEEKEAYLLWSSLRSELVQKQFYYLSSTAVQPECNKTFFMENVSIPIPINDEADKIIQEVAKIDESRYQLEDMLNRVSSKLTFL